ncbi:MAG: DinB family protein [Dehalococcoidia bacterium]
MQRDALLATLRESGVEALAAMAAVPQSQLGESGYENGWSVRQIMAHVASMEFTYRRLPEIARGPKDAHTGAGGVPFDMDGYNARQVERRADLLPEQLIDEFVRGRAALIEDVGNLPDDLLAVKIRSAGGVTGTLAEVLASTAGGHVRQHSADFLRAAGTPLSTGDHAAAAVVLAAEEAAQRLEAAPAERYLQRGSADDWPAAGIAGHLIEMLPYWAEKARALAADPTIVLGRALDAPERIGPVVEAERFSPGEAAARLRTAAKAASADLRAVPADAWSLRVSHRTYGPMTLAECVDRLLVQHAGEHLEQLALALDAADSNAVSKLNQFS